MNMKRTLYQWGAGIFFCLSALTACSDDDTPMEETILPPTPTVTLTAGETGYTTVNITLESTNALRCAYLVMEENEIMPDAQEVLDKGIVTTANKPMDILIEELDANTQYVVLAAAKGEEENVLASVKIATKAFSVPDKKHTLIFYYMGDNTGLETEMEANLRVIQGAAGHLIRLSDKNQVAVFYDNGKRSTLTKLVINEENNRTSHQIIEEYTQSDLSTAPVFMKNVLQKVMEEMPADSYGLVLSSHGSGWVPSSIFDKHVMAPSTRFIGQDGTQYMEIPALAQAFEGLKFEYLLFDACFMSSIEALYDLRNVTDYLIASPTEVLADGFPYKEIVSQLFQKDLKGACESFMNKYRQTSGTVALVQSNKLEALAAAVKNVVTAVGNKQVDLTAIQGYEGLNPHLFYDLEQYIEALTNDTDAFKAALEEAVIFTDHTPQFYSAYSQQPIGLSRSCGLSCFIDSHLFPDTQKAWLDTEWAKAIGAR